MKVKTLKRKFADLCRRLTAVRDHLCQPYEDRIRTLYYAMKEVRLSFPVNCYVCEVLQCTKMLLILQQQSYSQLISGRANTVDTFKNRLDGLWQNQEVLYNWKADICTGNRSQVSDSVSF